MELSPFDYTGPLPPERVQGRDDLLADLTERVTARTPTALLGPRRFGKTSVLRRLTAELESAVITIDLMPVQSARDAALALLGALTDAGAAVSQEASAVSAGLGFNLVALRGELRATRSNDRADADTALRNLVDTLVQTALARPTVIVFDEFQQIGNLANGTALLRAGLQRHYKDIGLLFAGSAPSAMRQVFANHDQPFLHQADLVEIGPLDQTAVQQLVDDGFAETGRSPGALGALLHQFTGGHPLRTMQAAHRTWQLAVDQPGDSVWGVALADLRDHHRAELAVVYDQLPLTQRKALRLTAHLESLFGTAAAAVDLGKGAAQQARSTLLADGHLVDRDDRLAVTDPFLADWLQRTLPL